MFHSFDIRFFAILFANFVGFRIHRGASSLLQIRDDVQRRRHKFYLGTIIALSTIGRFQNLSLNPVSHSIQQRGSGRWRSGVRCWSTAPRVSRIFPFPRGQRVWQRHENVKNVNNIWTGCQYSFRSLNFYTLTNQPLQNEPDTIKQTHHRPSNRLPTWTHCAARRHQTWRTHIRAYDTHTTHIRSLPKWTARNQTYINA